MGGSLTQPCRVKDEGAQHCKLLFSENKGFVTQGIEGIGGISTGKLRASSRGNT